MKTSLLILSIAFCLNANAQYTKLLDFAGAANGSYPYYTNLMQASDGMLYGMTGGGGANNLGVLFQYNPATSTYTKKLDFAGATNGSYPNGSLMQASDGMLYGMTEQGGANNNGVLFQYNPATNTYTKELDFAGGANGLFPYGSLMQASDGMLYGMTEAGGANGIGNIFQYNPATSTYTNEFDFAAVANGSSPRGSLMQASDGMLYGMTEQGGANSIGVLFQYNPATNTYTKELDFGGVTNGLAPYGSLMQASDGMLYGMTEAGGANVDGNIFQYNPAMNTYTNKLDFAGATNGNNPYGSLMQASDGMLYGMTQKGGANDLGVIFKYGLATGIVENNVANGFVIFPNPTSGQFNLKMSQFEDLKMNSIEITNIFGEKIYSSTVNSNKSEIDLSSQPNGIYFIQLKTENGIANKKIIINK